ncbi:unnamed protein product [Bursaphelenchus xylophilus]|uniref:(pine wood nematode) hypothetical protein n=1 Tax=Bursaphelenchus xylophilus TaxID=6326 RepID=A0A1I7RZ83_BURXY|nr:unnamed protein product [Bursaphelenchus xylophilus]CAG9106751.1 unnamed protein product [Bursaphelenchus xylophilus]
MAGGMGLYGGLNPYIYQNLMQYEPTSMMMSPYSLYTGYNPLDYYSNLSPFNPFNGLSPLLGQSLNPNVFNLNQMGNELQLGQNNLLQAVTPSPFNFLQPQTAVNPLNFDGLFKPIYPTLQPLINQGSTNTMFGAKINKKIPTVDKDITDFRRKSKSLHCQLLPLDPQCSSA